MAATNWDQLGIKFSVVPVERGDEAVQFMNDYFFPDEPIFRSLGYNPQTNSKLINGIASWFFKSEAVKSGTSVMATDKDGKMIGLRLGKKSKKKEAIREMTIIEWIGWFIPFCMWTFVLGHMWKLAHLMRLMREMKYEPHKAFDELGCQIIYEGISVVVAKDARVRGLGTELVRRSMDLAAEHGCEYMKLLATGEYSSKIFFRLNFNLLNQYEYQNFKDFDGKPLLTDTREHKVGRVFCIKLDNKKEEEKKNE